jgi:uncharacterized membrane protein
MVEDRARQAGGAAYAEAFGIGLIAGLRSMSAPLQASRALSERAIAQDGEGALGALAGLPLTQVLQLLAAAEMLADKLPFIPNRTSAPALIGRIAAGAAAGALMAASRRSSALLGALLGALGAAGATYASFYIRRGVVARLRVPDPLIGALEDLLVLGAGHLVGGRAGR